MTCIKVWCLCKSDPPEAKQEFLKDGLIAFHRKAYQTSFTRPSKKVMQPDWRLEITEKKMEMFLICFLEMNLNVNLDPVLLECARENS